MDTACPFPGRLLEPTADSHPYPLNPNPFLNTNSDANLTYPNFYTIAYCHHNIHTRAIWLPEATRRLHTRGSERLDAQPTHNGYARTRSGVIWWRTRAHRSCHLAG